MQAINNSGCHLNTVAKAKATILGAMLFALAFLPLTLLLTEKTAGAFMQKLVFSDSAEVVSTKVYLTDIAPIIQGSDMLKEKAKTIEITMAPNPQRTKIIKESQILTALSKHGINVSNTEFVIPKEVKITRKSAVYGQDQIEKLVREELLKRNFINNENTAFTISEIQKDVILPFDKDVSAIVKMPGNIGNVNTFWVSFYINGRLKEKIWARGEIKRYEEVLIANKDIGANEIIKEEDLSYAKKNILELNGDYFKNPRAVVNKKAALNISQGAVIRKESAKEVATVKVGDLVTILAQTKNLTISAGGKIVSPEGRVGDMVTVLNVDSKEKVQAVVLNSNTVKVEVPQNE